MTPVQGAIMGVVQGLTEFLPVSSSGHLAVARHLLHAGLAEDVGFEVAVHLGTLVAVLIFFRQRIISIFSEALKGGKEGLNWIGYIVIGTIPAGVVGLMFKDQIDELFNDIHLVGIAWIFTAIILFASERFGKPKVAVSQMGYLRAFTIGLAQALAIIPGISRSGSTIAASMATGVKKEGSVDFVFILSLPAIGGAALLTIKDWMDGSAGFGIEHILGGITAAISGYFAIAIMLKVVSGGKLFWFAAYCLVAGVVTVILV